MHIMEGFLPLVWCLFWYLLCIPFLYLGIRRLKTIFREHPEQKLVVAISGAFIFVLSSLKLPSISGSSSHPTGTGLSTILSGPLITGVLSTIVLIFQALLLAHGGITTLGANVFSMGIFGPFVAYSVYRVMQRAGAHPMVTVFVTAFIADMATYIMTSLQLALAYPTAAGVIPSLATFLGIFALTQLPLAVVEAMLMVMFFEYLANMRPELTRPELMFERRKAGWSSRAIIITVVAAVIIAVPLVLYEGQSLTGADDQGGGAIQEIDPSYVPWFESIFKPPEWLAQWLFLLQAVIGLTVLLLVIAYTRRRKKGMRSSDKGPKMGVDELAFSSPARNWPPLAKLVLAFSLLIVSLLSTTLAVPLMVMAIGVSLLFYSTRLRFPRVLLLALLDGLAVIIVGCVVIGFLTPGETLYSAYDIHGLKLHLYAEGITLATTVMVRALAGMMIMLFFITSTPVPHLAHAMRQLRLPTEMVEMTILVYRYSFLLFEQLDLMYTAATCRLGFRGAGNTVRTSSRLAVGLFSRSMEMAERSQVALQCRNFNGQFHAFKRPGRMTAAWYAISVGTALALYLGNILLTNYMKIGW